MNIMGKGPLGQKAPKPERGTARDIERNETIDF